MKISDWVLLNDHHCVVVNKPPGIPVQADKSLDAALIDIVSSYCKTNLHLIHRIDRPTSGLVIFAKKEQALIHLNHQFKERTVQKTYLAAVPKENIPETGELIHYLIKDSKRRKAIVQKAETGGSQKAVLHYRIVARSDRYQLLQISLSTGRFHQIRAQLAAIGCPVKGDVKYGARRKNKDRSIHLHAWKLSFAHPSTEEYTEISASPPDDPVWNTLLSINQS